MNKALFRNSIKCIGGTTLKSISNLSLPSKVRIIGSAALMLSVLSAVFFSLHWPLVGDASLMHYVVFLANHGSVPYRDIVDINLPGTYFFEGAAMRIFGAGAIGWRIYDLFLLCLGFSAFLVLAGKKNTFAGIFSGSLFALVHLQDGLAQGGQRDLLMAILLLWAYILLSAAQRGTHPILMVFLFGIVIGATVTIKPVLLPLALVLLALSAWVLRRRGAAIFTFLCAGILGIAIPCAASLLWLKTNGGLQAFLSIVTELVPLHAESGRQSLSFLLSHCLSPLALLFFLWLILQCIERPPLTPERVGLLICVLGTALAYIAQGKGYPYQRYPLLAVLLAIIGIDLNRALFSRGAIRAFAIAIYCLSCFILAPRYAWLVSTFSVETPFQTALTKSLTALLPPDQLSGSIQCLDTFGGCVATLYDLRVLQSTGFLYDCYLFEKASPEVDRYRASYWSAYKAKLPQIVVLTDQFCFGDLRGFAKISEWPILRDDLEKNYVMQSAWQSPVLQHWWSRKEQPAQFRIFIRKQP